jgi:hypothetical protein
MIADLLCIGLHVLQAPTLTSIVNTESLESAAEREVHEKPPERDSDRIAFLINNLSEDTLDARANEIKNKVGMAFDLRLRPKIYTTLGSLVGLACACAAVDATAALTEAC